MNLPHCEIFFTPPTTAQEILFIGGGRAPSREFFFDVASGRKIVCIDKGLELCRAGEIVPNFLIGDFDSASRESVAWARANKIPVERHPADKDLTDTQLALKRAAELFGEHVAILTGCFGGRVDHLYSTLLTCAAARHRIILTDEREMILFLRAGERASVKFIRKPLAVSLLPISEPCAGVTTKNLHWELEDATLSRALPNAVSNRVAAEKFSVSLGRGTLAVYLCFTE